MDKLGSHFRASRQIVERVRKQAINLAIGKSRIVSYESQTYETRDKMNSVFNI
jgi:hypothetical protein